MKIAAHRTERGGEPAIGHRRARARIPAVVGARREKPQDGAT